MSRPTDEPTAPSPNHRVNFETFFNGWLIRQQDFRDQLVQALEPENIHNEELHVALIGQVLSHYQQYYEEKSRAAGEAVFLFFSPPWFTPLERTFFWVGGFKPTFVVKLLEDSVKDLSGEQGRWIEHIKWETRREEKELGDTMARLQESMGSPPVVSLMRRFGCLVDVELSEIDSAVAELQAGMVEALESADVLRGKAARKVMEILSPSQTVKLLAAAAQLHLKVRSFGLQRDQPRASTSS